MAQSLKGLGLPVNFGFKSTASDGGVTATPFTGFFLLKSSLKTSAEIERIRVLQGDVGSENYYGLETDGDLTFLISKSAGTASSIAATSLANFTPGTIIAITAASSSPDLVYSYWVVQPGAEISQETTKSADLRVPLKEMLNVTATQATG